MFVPSATALVIWALFRLEIWNVEDVADVTVPLILNTDGLTPVTEMASPTEKALTFTGAESDE
jgi:hypothetical protein